MLMLVVEVGISKVKIVAIEDGCEGSCDDLWYLLI
jgi:hypothetical protein